MKAARSSVRGGSAHQVFGTFVQNVDPELGAVALLRGQVGEARFCLGGDMCGTGGP
jgi:hypothetical protein